MHPTGVAKFEVSWTLVTARGRREARRWRSSRRSCATGTGSSTAASAGDSASSGLAEEGTGEANTASLGFRGATGAGAVLAGVL